MRTPRLDTPRLRSIYRPDYTAAAPPPTLPDASGHGNDLERTVTDPYSTGSNLIVTSSYDLHGEEGAPPGTDAEIEALYQSNRTNGDEGEQRQEAAVAVVLRHLRAAWDVAENANMTSTAEIERAHGAVSEEAGIPE